MPITLGFHDVVEGAHVWAGVPAHQTVYTVENQIFLDHLGAIRARIGEKGVRRIDDQIESTKHNAVILTVDDGRSSALTHIAPALEARGWHGHFFVTTNWIGRSGFLAPQQIRELHHRGHLIGSHSCTHPQMSALTWKELVQEWTDSCALLGDLIGEPISVGSVPGGYYSRKVGEAAAASGIKMLFTSEPTTNVQSLNGCHILGRYSVRRSTPPSVVGAIAAGSKWPRCQQAAIWFINKGLKRTMGGWYVPVRRLIIDSLHGNSAASHP